MGEYDRRPNMNDPRRRSVRRGDVRGASSRQQNSFDGEQARRQYDRDYHGDPRQRRASDRVHVDACSQVPGHERLHVSPDEATPRPSRPNALSRPRRSADARAQHPGASRQQRSGESRGRAARDAARTRSSSASDQRTTRRPARSGRGTASARQHDIYVGAAPKRSKARLLPLIAAGVVVVALVAVAVFALPRVMSALTSQQGASQDGQAQDAAGSMSVSDQPAEPVSFTVTFAGDCTLGTDEAFSAATSFNARYDAEGDPSYFFRNVYDLFSSDDLTVVNMEGTLTESTARQDKTFAFKGPADYAQVLVAGDVEAASLANNHSRDYGEQSYTDTQQALDSAGIVTFGYDDIAYMDVKGVKVALVGTYELAEGAGIKDSMVANIQRARDEGAQVVMVYIHWGIERETVPNQTQMMLGHAAIDAGADLVIGSHPHVIQGYEKYQGRYIVYSLGNFCFGGNSNPSDKDCMIFQQTFTVTNGVAEQNDDISVIPCSISSTSSSNNYQPTPAEGAEADRINAKIQQSTDAIAAMAENF